MLSVLQDNPSRLLRTVHSVVDNLIMDYGPVQVWRLKIQLKENEVYHYWQSSSILVHYSDVIMSAMAFQITGVSIVYSTVCSGADQRKHQSSASLALVRGIHRWPVNSPHRGPVTRKMFFIDDVIMLQLSKVYSWCTINHPLFPAYHTREYIHNIN